MNVPFLDLKVQYKQIEQDVLPMMSKAMANGAFVGGPQVSSFETEFAKFCDSKYCVGLNSGTDALRFALIATGVDNRTKHLYCDNRSYFSGRRNTCVCRYLSGYL